MNNPFTLIFGKEPKSLISNSGQFDSIKDSFLSDSPTTTVELITGVRGSGKTVMLTRLSKYFSALKDWIVVELNPETDMLEYLASSVYEQANMKFRFLKKEFSFSFQGLSISLSGEKPVSNVVTLLEQMFEVIKKKGKKVLICIDDISNNQNVKTFVQQYQIFIRKDYHLKKRSKPIERKRSRWQNSQTVMPLLIKSLVMFSSKAAKPNWTMIF